MLIGIGIVGTLAASVAAYFVGEDDAERSGEIRERLERVEANQQGILQHQVRIEQLIQQFQSRTGDAGDGG